MSLIEVLVAIFIMAIGLLALLTLFPIGALSMAQAIQAERATQCAVIAHSIAVSQNVRNDPLVIGDGVADAYTNPNSTPPDASPYGPSYPLLIDPIGYSETVWPAQIWVGATPGVLARRRVSFAPITTPSAIASAFTLWDDLVFDTDPKNLGGPLANVIRDTRYSWAYLCQRPQNSEPSVVNCSIVVFNRRPLSLNGNLALPETVYQDVCYFDATGNTITINFANNKAGSNLPPPVRPGDWILDATPGRLKADGRLWPHGFYYRVVGINPIDANSTQYEVQSPLRGWDNIAAIAGDSPTFATGAFQGTAIVIEGVAEVFEKGPCRLP